MDPLPAGKQWCRRCNGYGSSLDEAAPRCTGCGGTGLVSANSSGDDTAPVHARRPRA